MQSQEHTCSTVYLSVCGKTLHDSAAVHLKSVVHFSFPSSQQKHAASYSCEQLEYIMYMDGQKYNIRNLMQSTETKISPTFFQMSQTD